MDSYGKKCNSRFLLNYGFIVRNNDANEYPFKIKLRKDDPNFQAKRNLLEQTSVKYRVMKGVEEKCFRELFGYMRFAELDDMSILPELIQ